MGGDAQPAGWANPPMAASGQYRGIGIGGDALPPQETVDHAPHEFGGLIHEFGRAFGRGPSGVTEPQIGHRHHDPDHGACEVVDTRRVDRQRSREFASLW